MHHSKEESKEKSGIKPEFSQAKKPFKYVKLGDKQKRAGETQSMKEIYSYKESERKKTEIRERNRGRK